MEGVEGMITQDEPGQVFDWSTHRVLVTGATGIIGSWLAKELLQRGAHVVALVRDADPESELLRSGDIARVRVVNGELEEFWTVERAINENEIDTVFHLGAQTIVGTAERSPLPTLEANVRGTYNVLEACRVHRDFVQWIVVASSDKAYGAQRQLPYTEDMPLNGEHPYEVSKSCADLIAQSYFRTYGLPIVIARCGNVFGGGDLNWSRIVPGTIRSLVRREHPVLRSDGSYIRDYTYVRDIALAYLALAEHARDDGIRGEAFNFSGESPLTVLGLVQTIQRLMGCENLEPQILNCAEGEIRSQYLSTEKARALLRWEPRYGLQQALTETIAWYRDFLG
jgi:CDP-glucose 4,6-dehydratase